jgi:hypothetical protein
MAGYQTLARAFCPQPCLPTTTRATFVRRSAHAGTWDVNAASFGSSYETPNRIRDHCRDGEGTDHMSQHASLFALAFGLVPEEHVPAVIQKVRSRGAACSVYAARYLMEVLFANGSD